MRHKPFPFLLMVILASVFIGRFICFGQGAVLKQGSRLVSRKTHFLSNDGWKIIGLYHPPHKGKPLAILVHGVGSDKGEFVDFSKELWKAGFGTLAIDLRGHGESLNGPHGKVSFKEQDALDQWKQARHDVEAAIAFARGLKPPSHKIGIIGASIGANLASQAVDPSIAWAVFLSPGMDYRGVSCVSPPEETSLLIAASPSDAYAYRSAVNLMRTMKNAQFFQASEGHGVRMFSDPDFLGRLVEWIKKKG